MSLPKDLERKRERASSSANGCATLCPAFNWIVFERKECFLEKLKPQRTGVANRRDSNRPPHPHLGQHLFVIKRINTVILSQTPPCKPNFRRRLLQRLKGERHLSEKINPNLT